ncbi:hypothetical protein, partial [Tetragenococcus koreensis]|uniref:hypothetical protein n=1 Tax=Tetragenococcus koreensis TaxID=290335 RepID=UPI001F4580F4
MYILFQNLLLFDFILYQRCLTENLLKAVEHNDSKQLRTVLDQPASPELSGYMKTSLKTLS